MEGSRDYAQVMHWNGRLRLLAQLQGAYHETLQAQGFDEEQAFMLVRDWSSRAWEWTLREEPLPLEDELPPTPLPSRTVDVPPRATTEPYLISVDRLVEEEASLGDLAQADADAAPEHDASSLDDIDEAA